MQPIVFDGCFGWLHPGDSRRGVVLCSALGTDGLRCHRSWRELADQLSVRGVTTIRFDYPGVGDSPGDAHASARVETWLSGIEAAVRRLRREPGIETVSLIGLRFGAALALGAAARLGDIDGVALLGPVVSGRAYSRELSMMLRLSRQNSGDEPESGLISIDGLAVTDATLADLSGFDPLAAGARPARALILTPEAVPPNTRFAQALRDRGVAVREGVFEGFAPLLWHPDFSRYPQAAFGQILDWIAPGGAIEPSPVGLQGEVDIPLPAARETVLGVGPGLAGVLCRPQGPAADAPLVLLLNTGALLHTGADRMWVNLARRLAGRGVTSLRFDIGGVGDSPARPDGLDPVENVLLAVADVRAVLDWLEARGHSRVCLVGYCWGAQLACNVALADPRVEAQILINPRRMFWTAEIPHHRVRSAGGYLKLIFQPRVWRKLLIGRIRPQDLRDAVRRLLGRLASDASSRVLRTESAADAAGRRVRVLAQRGVRSLLIYGEGDPQLDELEEVLATDHNGFAALFGVEFRLLTGLNHLFRRPADRERLVDIVGDYLGGLYPLPSRPAPAKVT